MKRNAVPNRSPELQRLAMLEGEWAGTGEVRPRTANGIVTMSGAWSAGRECNGWYLVTHEQFEIGNSGKVEGMAVWTWNPGHQSYRIWWFAESGATAEASARYHETERTWTLRFHGNGPDGRVVGIGRVRLVDHNTMEWSWTEWPAWDLLRITRPTKMHGIYTREEPHGAPSAGSGSLGWSALVSFTKHARCRFEVP